MVRCSVSDLIRLVKIFLLLTGVGLLFTLDINPSSLTFPSFDLSNTSLSNNNNTSLSNNNNTSLSNNNNTSLTPQESYFLVIAIPTLPGHMAQRDAIRATWLNSSRWDVLRGVEKHYTRIKVLFIFAKSSYVTVGFQKEMEDYGDMFMLEDIHEGRISLKYKVLWALRHSLNYNYDYFIKTDDDIFVNLPVLVQSLIVSPRALLYTGTCLNVYGGFGGYPRWRYCSGGGYVLSRDVVAAIQHLPPSVHQVRFRPEDGYTGWLIHCLNKEEGWDVRVESRPVLKLKPYQCGPFTSTWFYHGIRPDTMREMFYRIQNDNFVTCTDE